MFTYTHPHDVNGPSSIVYRLSKILTTDDRRRTIYVFKLFDATLFIITNKTAEMTKTTIHEMKGEKS